MILECLTVESLTIRTEEGDQVLPPGKKVALSVEKAAPLITGGKLIPLGKVAYKIFSGILQANIWLVADEEDRKALRKSLGAAEAIYTVDEIRMMKGMDADSLRRIHAAKKIFDCATVIEIDREIKEGECIKRP
jgi:hypothetical protein